MKGWPRWQGRTGAQTSAPRPAPGTEISAPRAPVRPAPDPPGRIMSPRPTNPTFSVRISLDVTDRILPPDAQSELLRISYRTAVIHRFSHDRLNVIVR